MSTVRSGILDEINARLVALVDYADQIVVLDPLEADEKSIGDVLGQSKFCFVPFYGMDRRPPNGEGTAETFEFEVDLAAYIPVSVLKVQDAPPGRTIASNLMDAVYKAIPGEGNGNLGGKCVLIHLPNGFMGPIGIDPVTGYPMTGCSFTVQYRHRFNDQAVQL